MSLTTVICKRGFDQIAFLFCLFLTYLLGTILMKPWRSKHAFYMDLALHSSLLCVLLISTGFALDDMARIPEINFSVSAWIFVVLPLLCAFPALVYLFFKKVRPDSQGKHTAQAQQMVQVFSQLTSVERVSRCLYQLTEDDRAGLQKALQIVSVELAAVDDSTPRSSRLSYTRDTSEKAAKTIQAGRDAETPISNGKAAENMKQEEHLVAAVYMKDVPADLAREEIHGAEIHASV